MRLNGFMALIAVVCVVGVMSGEILGPMAKLRFTSIVEAGGNAGGRIFRAGMAGDLFSDESRSASAKAEMVLGRPGEPLGPPDAETSPAVALNEHPAEDQNPGAVAYPVAALGISSGPIALSQADLSQSDFTPSTGVIPLSTAFGASHFVEVGGPLAAASQPPVAPTPPPTPAPTLAPAPEPASWLMLILGLGWVGLVLRRGRGRAVRPADDCAPGHIRS
jgi:hypothetical protein